MPRIIPQDDFRQLHSQTWRTFPEVAREVRNPVVRAVCVNIPHAVRTNLSEVVRSLKP